MGNGWFSSKGQAAQLIVGAIALLVSIINAWPSIRALDFLSAAPIVLYAVITLFLITAFLDHTVSRKIKPVVQETPSPEPNPLPDFRFDELFSGQQVTKTEFTGGRTTITFGLGQRWQVGQDIRNLLIVLHDIDDQSKRADVEIRGFHSFRGGSQTASLGENRFLLPVRERSLNTDGAFCINSMENLSTIDVIWIEHINFHARQVELTVLRIRSR